MLHIVMDGGGDIPADWLQEYDLGVIPINIHFKDEVFLQGVDLSNEEFYALANHSREIPKTSQPTPRQFVSFYKKIAQTGDTILSIHVTSKLSGTYNSAVLAAKELVGKIHVIPFDSQSGSAAMGLMCRDARLMERAGGSVQVILDRLNFISKNVSIALTLNTLEYARKSGRVKTLQAALASLLDVKPVAVLREGALYMADRVRTRNRAFEAILKISAEHMAGHKANVAIVQAQDPQAGRNLMERVRDYIDCQELILTDLSIGVAANLGPGTVGVVAYPVGG